MVNGLGFRKHQLVNAQNIYFRGALIVNVFLSAFLVIVEQERHHFGRFGSRTEPELEMSPVRLAPKTALIFILEIVQIRTCSLQKN
jgi:hypothetical protein